MITFRRSLIIIVFLCSFVFQSFGDESSEWEEEFIAPGIGVVANMKLQETSTLSENKAMVKDSKWSIDGTNWTSGDLSTETIAQVAASNDKELFIFTPIDGMSSDDTAVLPDILDSEVLLSVDDSITTAPDYFMYAYAKGCENIVSLDSVDTNSFTSVGDNFMAKFASNCTNLEAIGIPDTRNVEEIGDNFMMDYASYCENLLEVPAPVLDKLEKVEDLFMNNYAKGATNITSLKTPSIPNVNEVGNHFLFNYATDCDTLENLYSPDTSKIETAGDYFMSYYANNSVKIKELYLPNLESLENVGNNFLFKFGSGCTSLEELKAPFEPTFYDENSSIDLGLYYESEDFIVPFAYYDDWESLTSDDEFLKVNNVTSIDKGYILSFDTQGGYGNDITPRIYKEEDTIYFSSFPLNILKDHYNDKSETGSFFETKDSENEYSLDLENPYFQIASDKTIYKCWEEMEYTITFDVNSGNGEHYIFEKKYNDVFEELPVPSDRGVGYIFNGWFSEHIGGEKIEAPLKVEDDNTYYAQYDFIISFNSMGGTNVSSKRFAESPDEKLTKVGDLEVPERTGYTFVGWFDNKGNEITSEDAFNEPQVFYAKWSAKSYTVKFKDGSKVVLTKNLKYDSLFSAVKAPAKEGYKFSGYYTSKTFKEKAVTVSGETTVFIHYVICAPKKTDSSSTVNNSLWKKWVKFNCKSSYKIKREKSATIKLTGFNNVLVKSVKIGKNKITCTKQKNAVKVTAKKKKGSFKVTVLLKNGNKKIITIKVV